MSRLNNFKLFKKILLSVIDKDKLLLNCFKRINDKENACLFRKEKNIYVKYWRLDKTKITKLEAASLLKTSLYNVDLLVNCGFLPTEDGLVFREDVYDFIDLIRLYEKAITQQLIVEIAKEKKVYRLVDTRQSKLGSSQRILLFELFSNYFSKFFELLPLSKDIDKTEAREFKKDLDYFIELKKKELGALLRLRGKTKDLL